MFVGDQTRHGWKWGTPALLPCMLPVAQIQGREKLLHSFQATLVILSTVRALQHIGRSTQVPSLCKYQLSFPWNVLPGLD